MGYEVHITRKSLWSDDQGPEISLREWLEYVATDAEMRADGFAQAETPEGTIRIDNEGIAVWTAYSGHDVAGNMAWFCHFGDRVTVKNPDQAILEKMHQISARLNAKVQGDEGEEYGPDGSPVHGVARPPASGNRPWWKFWG